MADALVSQGPRHSRTASSRSAALVPDGGAAGVVGAVPPWYDLLVVLILAAVASFGSIGVLLAFFGWYRPAVVFPLGAVVTAVLVALGRNPLRGAPRTPSSELLPAIGMLVVAAGSMLINAVNAGHYLVVDRDPGVYAVTAKWIAAHGSLEISAAPPWHVFGGTVDYSSSGLYPEGTGRLEFQFAHFMPALMAEAQNVGGDRLMFALPAITGALSLCVLYAVGCRLLRRPWLSLVAVTAVAVALPQLIVSRDSYSETATQLLLWGAALALLRAWERRSARLAVFAGLMLGAVMTSRIDAMVYLVLVPLVLALAWLSSSGSLPRRGVGVGIGLIVLFCIPGTVLGTYDVKNRAGGYYAALKTQVDQLRAVLAAMAVLAVLIVLVWPRISRWPVWARVWRLSSVVVPGLVIAGLAGLWAVRPYVQHPLGSVSLDSTVALQQAAGLPIDGRRTYAEKSMTWLASYIGAPALALAILGVGILAWVAVRRGSPAAWVVLALAGVGTALYLWSPSISPDQAWASRRYVPAALPFLALAGAVGVEGVHEWVRSLASAGSPGATITPAATASSGARAAASSGATATPVAPRLAGWSRRLLTLPAVLGAVVMLVFPALTTKRVWRFDTQANFITVLDRTCSTIGPDSAVLFSYADLSGRLMNQTVHSFCGVPSASAAATLNPQQVSAMSAIWRTRGKTLWVLSFSQPGVQALLPQSSSIREIGAATSTRDVAVVLNKAPSRYAPRSLAIFGAPAGV